MRAPAFSMTTFDPNYPNETSLQYKRGFLAGCELSGLTALPDTLLSHAIDRALGAGWPALRAGKAFSMVYHSLHKRSSVRTGRIMSVQAYLLAAFEDELGKHNGNL